jgi:hypothetical protein
MSKPELILIKQPTVDDLIAMFERITGRRVTPDERRDVEVAMRNDDPPR